MPCVWSHGVSGRLSGVGRANNDNNVGNDNNVMGVASENILNIFRTRLLCRKAENDYTFVFVSRATEN